MRWPSTIVARFLIAAPGLIAASVPSARGQDTGTVPNREQVADRLDAFIQPYVDTGLFNGTVLVGAGDYVLVSRSYGMADYELEIPNRFETKYRIASLSKQFTMAAIGVLMDEGAVTPQSKLSAFIPDYPSGNRITIEQLLRHRSGVPHTNDLSWMQEVSRISLDEMIEGLKNEPLDFEPGTERKYSNGGYAVLAKVIEVASGLSYCDFLDRRVLEPLQLGDTGEVNTFDPVDGIATGYVPGIPLGERSEARFYPAQIRIGGGSLYSRAEDVWHLFRKTYQHMVHSEATSSYLFGDRTAKGEITGRSPGFVAKVYVDTPNDIVIVSLANNYSYLGPWARSLYRVVMEEADEFLELEMTPSTLSARRARYYSGRYRFGSGEFEIYLGNDGNLVYHDPEAEWRVPLVPLEGGAFYMPFYDRICEFEGAAKADSILYRSRIRGDQSTWSAHRVADAHEK
jgi:CubicO group peptidase (beta-lactamase class C family)